MIHWFLHFMGVEPRTPSSAYNFWSGFGSDIGEVVLLGAVYGMYRRHICGVTGCWRIGKHPVGDGTHVACRKHHPEDIPKVITPEYLAVKHGGSKQV